MPPLRPPPIPAIPAIPNLLAFHRPPLTQQSLHCPPPLTPTTPPPNDHYPSTAPTPQRLPPPPPLPPSPHAPTSVLTLCSPPDHTVDPPPIPPDHHPITLPSAHAPSSLLSSSFEASSNPPPTSPSSPQITPALLSHPTPKRRRSCPPHPHPNPSRTPARSKKPRTTSSKYAHGLKDFTTTVARKLRFYGSASYTSVADELVEDAITRLRSEDLPFNEAEVDKNVRRRVYDALNVFSSMGFVNRNAKTVVWNGKDGFLRMVGMSGCGCPQARHTCALAHVETQKRLNAELTTKLREKRARLDELRHQEEFVQWIVRRNASKDGSRITTGSDVRVGDDLEFKRPDHNRVDLPFIMVSAARGTSVSVEMEDGRESIVLDFDRAFRLWDGFSIAGRVVQRGNGCGGILYDGVLQQSQQDATFDQHGDA